MGAKLLGSFGLLLFGLRWLFAAFALPAELLLEFFDSARGVNELHLAGEERMARRANFDGDGLLGASRRELIAATASHGCFFVFGVNAFLHDRTLNSRWGPGKSRGMSL